jgi:membrane protein required for beta-lactamase induction
MSLLAILISLALEKFLPTLSGLRNLNWIAHYQQWIQIRLAKHEKWQGLPSLLIIVLLPVIGTAAVQYYLNDLLALFSFLFSIVVLTYCLGPQDEHRRANSYLDAIEDENRSDTDSIQTDLSEILQAGGIVSDVSTMDEESRINRLIYAVLIITHERILAILFWFVILGPMGAVLYRLTLALLENAEKYTTALTEPGTDNVAVNSDLDNDLNNDFNSDFNNAVKQLHHLLGWIPSHLTALSYAAMGSFVHALHAWQDRRKKDAPARPDKDQMERRNVFNATTMTESANRDLLLRIGIAALQFNNNPPQDNNAVRETLGLCGRSLVAWITILAIMTLAGWAS